MTSLALNLNDIEGLYSMEHIAHREDKALTGNSRSLSTSEQISTTEREEEEKYYPHEHLPVWDLSNSDLVEQRPQITYQDAAYQHVPSTSGFHSYWGNENRIYNQGTGSRLSLRGNENDAFACLPFLEDTLEMEDDQLFSEVQREPLGYQELAIQRKAAKANALYNGRHGRQYGMVEGRGNSALDFFLYGNRGSADHQEITSDTVSITSTVFSDPVEAKSVEGEYTEDLQGGGSGLIDRNRMDDAKDGSFLFVTYRGGGDNPEKELVDILRQREFTVLNVRRTTEADVFFVLFDKHSTAKRAFTSQSDIKLRMVPPVRSKKNWRKNPAPNFRVQFETLRRLTVKKGKSTSKTNVGELLMKDAKNKQGCIIWADQLKGQRLRIVGYVGRLMLPDGHIVEEKNPPSETEKNVVGWISKRCNLTRTEFVERKSGITLEEYFYKEN